MPDNISFNVSTGRYEMAFSGDRNNIWHRHGQQVDGSKPLDYWFEQAGMFEAEKRQAYYFLGNGEQRPVDGQFFIVRKDNDFVLSPSVTSQYQIHQPREIAETFDDLIKVDDRFQWSAMGTILGGARMWCCASFNGDLTVGGDHHKAYLLSTTAFDKSAASQSNVSFVRSVCENTIQAALSGAANTIVTRSHRSAYDAQAVRSMLAQVAQSVDKFKAVGDAMATVELAAQDVSNFFKAVLDIPFDAKRDDISTRKYNIFDGLRTAYRSTVGEGTQSGKVWTALQAVTRYVDHDRSVRSNGVSEDNARFVAANFGTGDSMKQKAWNLLLPLVKDKVAVAA